MNNHERHSLGKRAFALFLMKRIKLSVFLFALTFASWYAERWVPAGYLFFANYTSELLLALSLAYFLIIFLITYIEYRYHSYFFTEEAFVVTRGYAVHNEIAALYHQIQNVNINRSPLDRLIGVSQIIIFMAGSDHEAAHNKIVLAGVGRTKARLVQKEILVRARKHGTQG